MYSFDGAAQYALHSATPPDLGDFTVALWLTAGADDGCILGAKNVTAFKELALLLNTAASNETRLYLKSGKTLQERLVSFTNPVIYNGATHLLIFTRSGATVRAWLDGTEQSLTVLIGTMTTQAITGLPPLAVGAQNQGAGASLFVQAAAAEVAFWTRAVTDAEVAILSGGFAPTFLSGLPWLWWRGLDGRDEIGGTWTVMGTLLAVHPAVDLPDGKVHDLPNPRRLGGYDVFVHEGSPAVVGVDLPVRRVGRDDVSVAIPLADLGLGADKSYCFSVVPFNLRGHAETSADAWLRTNGSGVPSFLPTPVTGLRLRALAGAQVEVRWTYDQLVGDLADEFVIEAEYLDAASPQPDDVVVAHLAPQREYRRVLQLVDGHYRVRVLSRRVGLADESVGWGEVLADATPPAEQLAGLAAI